MTFFWAHFSPEREKAEVAAMAAAAKAAGVKHVIWSTLEDSRRWIPLDDTRMPTLMGHYKVPHFDAKGESNARFTELGVPTTFLHTSFYWDNLIHFGMGPKPGPDGKLAFTLPMGERKLPGIAAEDIGKCAYGIFRAGARVRRPQPGHRGRAPHRRADGRRRCAKALAQEVRYNAITPAAFRAFGFPGADDLGNMFQFNHDFADEFCKARDIDESRRLNPALLDFDAWLAQNKARIPLA